jgi:hypothetical protein
MGFSNRGDSVLFSAASFRFKQSVSSAIMCFMNQSPTMEYRVQVFRNLTDGVERWKAFVVTIPAISAEAESREAVLEEIRRQLADIATSEITTVPGPIPERVVEGDGSELDLRLRKKGYRNYGIFADDPGAL